MRSIFGKPWLFLFLFALSGIFTFRDFGVPVDDFTQYVIGQQNYHVLIGESTIDKIDPGIRYYGPVFETFCYAIDSMFYGEPEPIQKWGMRHVFVWILFTLSLLFLYKTALILFQNNKIAWVLMLLTAFCPRLFADAHYNSKDTVFLSLIAIGIYFLVKAINRKHSPSFLIAAIILGMATTIRLAGLFIIPALLMSVFFSHKNYNKKYLIWVQFLVFTGVFILSYYVFFPALWKHPIHEFSVLFDHITHFPWPNKTLVAGHWVNYKNMPAWYFPVWFFITIPILYHVLFLISIAILIVLYRKIGPSGETWFLVFFLSIVTIYVVFQRPNLYDGWRQLQFIFIPFILLSGTGIRFLMEKGKIYRALLGFLCLYQFMFIVILYPFHYVYFNEYYMAFGKKNTYDQDYWYLSTGAAMKWISEHTHKTKPKVYTRYTESAWYNTFLFPPDQKLEFIPVNNDSIADYEIEPIRNGKPYNGNKNVVYSICPLKDTIVRVIQLKPE